MLEPITKNNEIKWLNFIRFLKVKSSSMVKFAIFAILLACLVYFNNSNKYEIKISFYANYNEQQGPSLFSSFITPNSSSSNLDFSISDFIISDKFLTGVVSDKYTLSNGKQVSLIDLWGEDYNKIFYLNPLKTLKKIDYMLHVNNYLPESNKKENFVKLNFSNSILHEESRFSGLNTISFITNVDQALSRQIIQNIYDEILNYSTGVVNIKAKEKRLFITNQLIEVKSNLNNAENKKAKFLIENKDIKDSPNLTLEKSRIDRDVNLLNQLYFTLSDQLELAKIDEQDSTSPIFVLDSETISYSKLGNTLLNQIFLYIVLSIIISTSYFLFQERKNLFL
jgi:hypothetical protein